MWLKPFASSVPAVTCQKPAVLPYKEQNLCDPTVRVLQLKLGPTLYKQLRKTCNALSKMRIFTPVSSLGKITLFNA